MSMSPLMILAVVVLVILLVRGIIKTVKFLLFLALVVLIWWLCVANGIELPIMETINSIRGVV